MSESGTGSERHELSACLFAFPTSFLMNGARMWLLTDMNSASYVDSRRHSTKQVMRNIKVSRMCHVQQYNANHLHYVRAFASIRTI